MSGAFLVSALSDKSVYVFVARLSSKSSKSKVKKVDSIIDIEEKNQIMIDSNFLDDQTIHVTYGNIFQMMRSEEKLFDNQKIR